MALILTVFFSWVASTFAQDNFQPDLFDRQRENDLFFRSKTAPGNAPTLTTDQTGNAFMPTMAVRNVPEESPNPFSNWSLVSDTFTYGYGYKHSFQDGSHTEKNNGSISVVINAPDRFSLQPSLGVSGSTVESTSGASTSDSLSVNPAIQIGNILFTNRNQKIGISGSVGYTATDNNSLTASKVAYSQASGWKWAGGFSYEYDPTTNSSISLSPSYSYTDNQTVNFPLGTTTETFQGNLSSKLKILYDLPGNWGGSAFGTWFHSINFSTAPGQSGGDQDWAQFGADLTYTWRRKLNLDVGYSYEAFNTTYFTHAVSVQLSYKF